MKRLWLPSLPDTPIVPSGRPDRGARNRIESGNPAPQLLNLRVEALEQVVHLLTLGRDPLGDLGAKSVDAVSCILHQRLDPPAHFLLQPRLRIADLLPELTAKAGRHRFTPAAGPPLVRGNPPKLCVELITDPTERERSVARVPSELRAFTRL